VKKGFQTKVISPAGTSFERKSIDRLSAINLRERPQQRIPFQFSWDESMEANTGIATLYNIKNKDLEGFKHKKELKLHVGWLPYGKNEQLVIKGTILDITTYPIENRKTMSSDIKFRDTPLQYHEGFVSRKWGKGTQATQVFKDIVEDEIGTQIEYFQPKREPQYRRGKSFYCPIIHALRQVVNDLKSKMFFYNKKAYLLPTPKTVPPTQQIENKDLIKGVPSKTKGEKQITTLFNSKLKPATKVSLASEGAFRVYSGKHYSTEGKKLRTDLIGSLK